MQRVSMQAGLTEYVVAAVGIAFLIGVIVVYHRLMDRYERSQRAVSTGAPVAGSVEIRLEAGGRGRRILRSLRLRRRAARAKSA